MRGSSRGGRARRRVALVVALALCVSAGTGAVVARALSSTRGHVRGVVTLVGDSNLLLASQSVNGLLANRDNGYVPVFLPHVGAGIRTRACYTSPCTIYYWETRLAEALPRVDSDAIVVNLGVNDTHSAGTPSSPGYAAYDAKVDWFMGLLPDGVTVLWTNLPCQILPATRYAGCRAVNTALAAAASRWPNLVVVNWAAVANSHPEYIVTGDVHYTAYGRAAWARLVTRALDLRFPPP
jgi:hypothetical protein